MNCAIVLCGGSSHRFGSDKLSVRIFSKSISISSIEKFIDFHKIVVTLPKDKLDIINALSSLTEENIKNLSHENGEIPQFFHDSFEFPISLYNKYNDVMGSYKNQPNVFWEVFDLMRIQRKHPDKILYIIGGNTRGHSVQLALSALPKETSIVSIHDGARPYVNKYHINATVDMAEKFGSGVLSCHSSDTLRKFKEGCLEESIPRNLLQVQTPQTFQYKKIMEAYKHSTDEQTDDSLIYSNHFGECRYVIGTASNYKITHPSDVQSRHFCGFGYDVHRLESGRPFVLGGITLPHYNGMVAHSDGDVLIHAICDALLSAMSMNDIGHQFPDTDKEYKNIDSKILLKKCIEFAHAKDLKIVHISTMIMAEKPKMAPHLDTMKKTLCKILEIPTSVLSISATTTETLGIIGEEKGVCCCCFLLLA